MCIECRSTPCDSRCPNADEPEVIHSCAQCAHGILEGEEFVFNDCSCFHLNCVEDLYIEELLALFGVSVQTAQARETEPPAYDEYDPYEEA